VSAGPGGSERIYRGLLRLYPADYRERYSEQMVQLFADQRRETGGRAWLSAPIDVITTAASEHLRRNRTMAHSLTLAPTPLTRLLGLFGLIGGASLLAAFVVDLPNDANYVRIFVFGIGGLTVVTAIHLRQRQRSPRLALAGAVPALVFGAWMFVMQFLVVGREPPVFGGAFGWVYFWGSIAMWLGYAWFGVVTFVLHQVTRIGSAALAVGSLLAILGIDRLGLVSVSEPTVWNTVALTGVFLHGLAWVILGLDVAFRRRPAPTATA
jgi:hypothetical protein